MHFARRALGWEDAIAIVDGMVELAPDADVTVDSETFEREALSAQRSCDISQFATAAELYTGDLLPEDLYEPWAEDARRDLHRKYVQVLRAGAQWERLVEVDPFDEAAHRALIRQHLVAGDRASALQCYERLTTILDEELGIDARRQSQALYDEALAQADDAPPTAEQRASVLLGSALLCTHRGALDQAEQEASQARQLAAQAGLGRQLGEASALLGMVAHMRGRWRELFLGEFLDTVQRPPSMASYVFDAHLCLAEVWVYGGGGVADGQEFAAELFAIAEEYDSVHGRALANLVRGEASLLSGRARRSQRRPRDAVSLHQAVGAESGYALSMARLAEVALAAGDHRRAEQLATRSLELARTGADRIAPRGPHPRHQGRAGAIAPRGHQRRPRGRAAARRPRGLRAVLDALPGRRGHHLRPRPATSTPRPATSTPPAASPGCGPAAPGRPPSGRPAPPCAWPRGGASRPSPCSRRRPTSSPGPGTPSPSPAAGKPRSEAVVSRRPVSRPRPGTLRERPVGTPAFDGQHRIRRGTVVEEQVVEAIRAGARR